MGYWSHEVSIVLTDDEGITRLNRQYFNRHRPTNVIAFPMAGGEPALINPQVLGDVVISVETARRQSRAIGGKTEDEVLFLMIHGILHLLGYDHEGSADERRAMEVKERELFSLLKSPTRQK